MRVLSGVSLEPFRRLPAQIPTPGSWRTIDAVAVKLGVDGSESLVASDAIGSLRNGALAFTRLPEAPRPTYDYSYRMRQLAAGDLTAATGPEIAAVDGPDVALLDAGGKLLGRAHAPFGFTAIAYLPGKPHGSVVLGSSPNGDDNLYRVHFQDGWQKSLTELPRVGHIAAIGKNLADLSAEIAQWHGTPIGSDAGPYRFALSHHFFDRPEQLRLQTAWMKEVHSYRKEFPYPNVQFGPVLWIAEKAPHVRPDGKAWGRDRRLRYELSHDEIVAAVTQWEKSGCSF